MRTNTPIRVAVALSIGLLGHRATAATLDGTLKLGGIILDETGDLSAVQETYNIYDGFNVSEVSLTGTLNPRNHFRLFLTDINLDSRRADFQYRMPGTLKLTGGYDQHRQVFDPARAVASDRKEWRLGATYTPVEWMRFSGSYNDLTRSGDRLPFPAGTASALGERYDNVLRAGQIGAEVSQNGRGVAVQYRISDFSDDLNAVAARRGHVVSARLFATDYFYDKLTHLLRGAWGISELSDSGLDYTLANFQYLGVVRPVQRFQFKYNFEAQRVDNKSTRLKTDRYINDFDASFDHPYGNVFGGYGYEINDDDRSLTSYHVWRAGTALRYRNWATAKFRYAGRTKDDLEDLTLLKDLEAMRVNGDLEITPIQGLAVGGSFNVHEREYPDISVQADGESWGARGRYQHDVWGGVSVDYVFSNEEYIDRVAGFTANSHIVTGRVDVARLQPFTVAGGVTYLDIGEELDIEKSIIFLEAAYAFLNDFHVEVKYNVYNYDDYILRDRYYTADVVWLNVAYDLHVR